ncbi:MAG: hypothetical protein U0800_09780 [Isosphaeraceae bacterium]
MSDASQSIADARLRSALVRLGQEKAPETVTQLVLWQVGTGLDWNTLGQLTRSWSNGHELALARSVVARLDSARGPRDAAFEDGVLYLEVSGGDADGKVEAERLVKALKASPRMLGLKVRIGIPSRPEGPSMSARIDLAGGEGVVQVQTTDARGIAWTSAGKFALAIDGEPAAWGDRIAEGVLGRVVRVQLSKGPKIKGKDSYRVRIENASPFVLAGLALGSLEFGKASAVTVAEVKGDKAAPDAEVTDPKQVPSVLGGLAIPPRRNYTVGATAEVVEGLGLKSGVRLLAADLNGL